MRVLGWRPSSVSGRNAIRRHWIVALALGVAVLVAGPVDGALAKHKKVKTTKAVRNAGWDDNVQLTVHKREFRYRSDGIPSQKLEDEYIMPDCCNPKWALNVTPEHAHIEKASKAIQPAPIDKTITTRPKKVKTKTSVTAGAMGVTISGAPVYNPYEGNGSSVAMASNFSLTDKQGHKVWFVDGCAGHPAPAPLNQYHYHGLPKCVTSQVDRKKGRSHMMGVAYDGFPIYGNRNIHGKIVKPSKLDRCNGIHSATPEFPNGIYHYVLTTEPTVQSTIRCLHGKVDESLLRSSLERSRHGKTKLSGAFPIWGCGGPAAIRRF